MCMNNSMCGCSSNNNECENFGPFLAVDAACITPTTATAGSIIPFASGLVPVVMVTTAAGLIDTVSIVGFGTAFPSISLVGGNINLANVVNEAFNVPRPGTITAISASFSSLVTLALVGTVTIRAQVYKAVAGSDIFSPTTAFVDLKPSLTALAIGTFANGTTDVTPVPVAAGDRLLMVFSSTATGIAPLVNIVTGTASAGINIE